MANFVLPFVLLALLAVVSVSFLIATRTPAIVVTLPVDRVPLPQTLRPTSTQQTTTAKSTSASGRHELSCDEIALLLLSDNDGGRGDEKQVHVADWLDGTRLAVKVPLSAPASPELWRRFRNERTRMLALAPLSPNVARSLGACFEPNFTGAPLAPPVHVVEYAAPWKSIPDTYFAVDARRAVDLYAQVLRFIRFLSSEAPDAPLFLCDFHRGQFGVTYGGRLRLLDVDSLYAYDQRADSRVAQRLALPAHAVSSASALFGDVKCTQHSDCAQALRQRRCMAVLANDEPALEDLRCNQTSLLCHGVDEATMVAASRVLLERVRDSFDPTQLNCNAKGCVFSDEARRRQGVPESSGLFSTPHTRNLARLLTALIGTLSRRQKRARPSVDSVLHALEQHVLCEECAEPQQIEQHIEAIATL